MGRNGGAGEGFPLSGIKKDSGFLRRCPDGRKSRIILIPPKIIAKWFLVILKGKMTFRAF